MPADYIHCTYRQSTVIVFISFVVLSTVNHSPLIDIQRVRADSQLDDGSSQHSYVEGTAYCMYVQCTLHTLPFSQPATSPVS